MIGKHYEIIVSRQGAMTQSLILKFIAPLREICLSPGGGLLIMLQPYEFLLRKKTPMAAAEVFFVETGIYRSV